jgi:hypothetical protein
MQWSVRSRPVLAVLATMLAGLALATSAGSLIATDPAEPVSMPSDGCPPSC